MIHWDRDVLDKIWVGGFLPNDDGFQVRKSLVTIFGELLVAIHAKYLSFTVLRNIVTSVSEIGSINTGSDTTGNNGTTVGDEPLG